MFHKTDNKHASLFYQKYKQKAPTSTGGEMNAFRAQHDICSQTVRKEVYSGVPR